MTAQIGFTELVAVFCAGFLITFSVLEMWAVVHGGASLLQ